MLAAVDVGAELAAFFLELADAGEREDLEAAAVGEDRTVPAVELVQAACCPDDVKTWAQVEVIGVSEDNLCHDLLLEFLEVDALHASYGSYGHEDWGLDLSVVGGDDACTRIACFICYL